MKIQIQKIFLLIQYRLQRDNRPFLSIAIRFLNTFKNSHILTIAALKTAHKLHFIRQPAVFYFAFVVNFVVPINLIL